MCVCVWYTIAPLLLLKMSFRNLCFQFKKILVTLKLEVNCKRITNFCSPCIRYSQFFKMVFIVVLFFAYITLIFILNLTSFFSSEKFKHNSVFKGGDDISEYISLKHVLGFTAIAIHFWKMNAFSLSFLISFKNFFIGV